MTIEKELLKELKILNKQMEVLIVEHVKHFREWSKKNGQ
jgi:hypothetical protein